MKSELPKVLHDLAGRPLLAHVIDRARELQPDKIVVVYGHGGERVPEAFAGQNDLVWVEQTEQLGTGHALLQAMPRLQGVERVLVLYGDVPLISVTTLQGLLDSAVDGFGLLTVTLAEPTGYGRIVRDATGRIQRIVEQKDASVEERAIREINTGIMLLPASRLSGWLEGLSNQNARREYYLTDVVAQAVAEGIVIRVAQPADALEAEGTNDRVQLAAIERAYQAAQASSLMRAGLTLRDPARFDLRGELQPGIDNEIDVNVLIEGRVVLGDRVRIGANCTVRNSTIGDDVVIEPNCVIEDAVIGAASRIGPFARLRPGANLVGQAHIGNFVEVKKSIIGQGSKVNHLSYVGDAEIGEGVNLGAGTITCNYDGAYKHKTEIGDSAFIGSNTALVAPVKVGPGATIGAGSVIGRDAPEDMLTLTRAKQVSVKWRRPTKKKT